VGSLDIAEAPNLEALDLERLDRPTPGWIRVEQDPSEAGSGWGRIRVGQHATSTQIASGLQTLY